MSEQQTTAADLRREILIMDPGLKEGSPEFNAQLVLLGAAVVGPSIVKLSKFLGLGRETIRPMARRLRENGIWRGNKIDGAMFEKGGGLHLVLHSMVALGLVEASFSETKTEE